MNRQYLLTRGTPQEVRDGVDEGKRHLWKNGGWLAALDAVAVACYTVIIPCERSNHAAQ